MAKWDVKPEAMTPTPASPGVTAGAVGADVAALDRQIAEAVAAERERCAGKIDMAAKLMLEEALPLTSALERRLAGEISKLLDAAAAGIRGQT